MHTEMLWTFFSFKFLVLRIFFFEPKYCGKNNILKAQECHKIGKWYYWLYRETSFPLGACLLWHCLGLLFCAFLEKFLEAIKCLSFSCLGLAASICMWSTKFSFHSTNSAPEWTGGELFHCWYNFVFALKTVGLVGWDLHLGSFLGGGVFRKS